MSETHTQAAINEENRGQVEETLRRLEEQYTVLAQTYGLELEKLAAGLLHQQALAQIIMKLPEIEHLQQQTAEMASISEHFGEQLLSVTQVASQFVTPIAQAIQASGAIANLIQSATAVNTDRLQQVRSITQGLDDVARMMTANLTVVGAARWLFEQLGVFKTLREFVEEEETAVEAFRSAGWSIAPSMPKALIRRVVELHREGKTRYVSQAIIGYYRRNNCKHLVEAVERWRSHRLFVPRMHIIQDALWAHLQRKFTLSVPALIAQVEGILNEYVVVNDLPAKLGKIKEVYETVIGNPMDYDLYTWAIAETLLCQLRTNTYAWTPFEHEINRPVTRRHTTRHTILHGIMPGYDREIHSLRIFLLLDALSVLQQFESAEENEL